MPRAPFLALAFIISLAAIFSRGILHYDEHFQIIEFANFLVGGQAADSLTWEFGARIRPWFQPSLVAVALWMLKFVGIDSPFHQMIFIRLVFGALWFVAIYSFVWRMDLTPRDRRRLPWLFTCLVFLPALYVRTSSESFSSMLLLACLALLLNRRPAWLQGGLFAGLCFYARFQMGIALGILTIWLLWKHRNLPLRYFSGLLISLAGNILLDSFVYGQTTLSFWNYFVVNLIDGKAAEFGTLPFWGYLNLSFASLGILVSLIALAVFISFLLIHRRDPVAWILAAYCAVHCFIGHKELRFLMPLAFLAPYIVTKILSNHSWPQWRYARQLSIFLIAAISIMAIKRSTKHLTPELVFLEQIDQHGYKGDLVFFNDSDPLIYRDVLAWHFYQRGSLSSKRSDHPARPPSYYLALTEKWPLSQPSDSCQILYQPWDLAFLPTDSQLGAKLSKGRRWRRLFYCETP